MRKFLAWKDEYKLFGDKSLRLNIFKGITIPEGTDLGGWVVKDNIEWIENCPLPSNEVFMKIGGI